MSKLFVLLTVLMISTVSASPLAAQARFHKEFTPSDKNYSESKQLYAEGVKYALAGFFSQAVELFQRAIRLDPKFADAHFALGHAYFDIGRWQQAAESFKRALELNPNDLEARDRLEESREMLARETNKKPGAKQPVAEQVALSSKPATPPLKTEESASKPVNIAAASNVL